MATPIRQLLSQTSYNTDGVTTIWDFSFSGGYLDQSHVKASYRTPDGDVTQITVTPGMFVGPFQLNISPAIPAGVGGDTILTIYRDTPKDLPLVNFADKASLTEVSLDTNAQQAIFAAAECTDTINTSLVDANVQLAIDAADLALSYATAAQVSADAAAAQAAAAADSAQDAIDALSSKSDLATTVTKDTDTGAANVPVGTTAQRPSAGAGKFRFNSTLGRAEINNGSTWGSLGGATGGGPDAAFYENDNTITTSYTLTANRNAMSAGPITVNSGATVTVPTGQTWSIV